MKTLSFYKHSAPTALLFTLIFSALVFVSTTGATNSDNSVASPSPQADASTSLSRGRALLKQGHADQALPLLESALRDFTASKDGRGIAAAEDALGDLYMVQGQYKVALDHYQKAYQAFAAGRGSDAANQAGANTAAGLAGSSTAWGRYSG